MQNLFVMQQQLMQSINIHPQPINQSPAGISSNNEFSIYSNNFQSARYSFSPQKPLAHPQEFNIQKELMLEAIEEVQEKETAKNYLKQFMHEDPLENIDVSGLKAQRSRQLKRRSSLASPISPEGLSNLFKGSQQETLNQKGQGSLMTERQQSIDNIQPEEYVRQYQEFVKTQDNVLNARSYSGGLFNKIGENGKYTFSTRLDGIKAFEQYSPQPQLTHPHSATNIFNPFHMTPKDSINSQERHFTFYNSFDPKDQPIQPQMITTKIDHEFRINPRKVSAESYDLPHPSEVNNYPHQNQPSPNKVPLIFIPENSQKQLSDLKAALSDDTSRKIHNLPPLSSKSKLSNEIFQTMHQTNQNDSPQKKCEPLGKTQVEEIKPGHSYWFKESSEIDLNFSKSQTHPSHIQQSLFSSSNFDNQAGIQNASRISDQVTIQDNQANMLRSSQKTAKIEMGENRFLQETIQENKNNSIKAQKPYYGLGFESYIE